MRTTRHRKPPMPRQIRILGKVFDVSYIPHLKAAEDGEELHGQMHPLAFKIDINSIKSRSAQESTLFHEAIHGALDITGLADLIDNEKLEEAIVRCIECAFADVVDIYALSAKMEPASEIDNTETPGV